MNATVLPPSEKSSLPPSIHVAVVRFVGDSGDGMQILGEQFTSSTASHGNDLATLPDYPAEIRAPAGSLFGVSGFQIQFGAEEVFTPGDAPDVLVVMNPAALQTNLRTLRPGGLLLVNSGAFNKGNLEKAGYTTNPLTDDSLANYHLMAIDISRLTQQAVREVPLSVKDANRCKNFWTLGLTLWLYSRSLDATVAFIESKFKFHPELAQANILALKAGHAYGDTLELNHHRYQVPAAKLATGRYRSMTGNNALAWGLITGAQRAERSLVLGSYPITPATDLLQELSKHRALGVTTVQAEDEIAAACVALGASYAGSIGVTTTSGPGLALKMESIGLGVALELPLVVIDVQRAGPSTGMPTKTEQADLLQAIHGRPGESPLCVLAPCTPANCFDIAVEAVRLATKYMTPVIVLSDSTLATGAEPWKIPDPNRLPDLRIPHVRPPVSEFLPYQRDPNTLARAWVTPGERGYEYRIGGLEKDAKTGNISSDAENHELMTTLRAAKIARIASDIPKARIDSGEEHGRSLVVGWGSSYGPIHEAVCRVRATGQTVSHLHLTHLNPFPENLGTLLAQFEQIFVPEMNSGQLAELLRAQFFVRTRSLNLVQGRPFTVAEIEQFLLHSLSN